MCVVNYKAGMAAKNFFGLLYIKSWLQRTLLNYLTATNAYAHLQLSNCSHLYSSTSCLQLLCLLDIYFQFLKYYFLSRTVWRHTQASLNVICCQIWQGHAEPWRRICICATETFICTFLSIPEGIVTIKVVRDIGVSRISRFTKVIITNK